ncbi:YecR family lipoprotein [Alcanivorax sp. DP30]|uniref:YecR family lipoprotein n=1 Tax=Alcanivorax sp. DP30 TaxID=2606217 RepID=UPI001F42086F|nr:YecR family lipoprotein [Alcanivorax sp. DP30]
MQRPKVDWHQGLQKTSGQCQRWGYNGAIPAGKPSQRCKTETQQGNSIGWAYSADFECPAPAEQKFERLR